ncbi:tripartite tricarboxylate transporter substrate binding protein [Alcaligenaceae bacterium]|nr:tripartite tricarboxylate transporter substrate binding protein [Alcaligenaceae bacterium]
MKAAQFLRMLSSALLITLFLGFKAQAYPDKPVTLVVPAPPASFSDIVGRLLGEFLSTELGQPIVIENRGGASGTVAYNHAARSRPDGYTVLLTNLGPSAVNPELFKKQGLSYDPIDDFEPITIFSQTPLVLIVRKESKWDTVEELISDAKKNPGKISYATTGPGQLNHLSSAFLNSSAEIETLHVPYKSGAAAMTDILAGRVDFMFYPPANVGGLVSSGELKALGATGIKRTVALPDVPTLAELGYPQFDLNAWYGLAVPAGTPHETLTRLRDASRKVAVDPGFISKLHDIGIDDLKEMQSLTNDEIQNFHANEIERWSGIVQISGATLDY